MGSKAGRLKSLYSSVDMFTERPIFSWMGDNGLSTGSWIILSCETHIVRKSFVGFQPPTLLGDSASRGQASGVNKEAASA